MWYTISYRCFPFMSSVSSLSDTNNSFLGSSTSPSIPSTSALLVKARKRLPRSRIWKRNWNTTRPHTGPVVTTWSRFWSLDPRHEAPTHVNNQAFHSSVLTAGVWSEWEFELHMGEGRYQHVLSSSILLNDAGGDYLWCRPQGHYMISVTAHQKKTKARQIYGYWIWSGKRIGTLPLPIGISPLPGEGERQALYWRHGYPGVF